MADVRESFPSLEGATGEGLALRSVQEGQPTAAKNGSLALAFKDAAGNALAAPVDVQGGTPGNAIPTLPGVDTAGLLQAIPVKADGEVPTSALPVLAFVDSSGNLVYPQLNAAGAVPVSFDVGTDLFARGAEVPANNTTYFEVATITLAVATVYQGLEAVMSCFRDAHFEIYWNDDGAETILADGVCGPGSFTAMINLSKLQFTSGATGVQQLIIRGKVQNSLSDLRATIATTAQ